MEFRWIEWNVAKVESHGIRPEEAEDVAENASAPYPEKHPDAKFLVRGRTRDGKAIQVVFVYDSEEDDAVFIIHARPLTNREKGQMTRRRRKARWTTMKKQRTRKRVSELPVSVLEKMSAEFDREFVADTFGPMSAADRARFERAKKQRGRPRIGAGAQAISVTVEKNLLKAIDRIAKERKTTRAQLIAKGLEAIVQKERKAAG